MSTRSTKRTKLDHPGGSSASTVKKAQNQTSRSKTKGGPGDEADEGKKESRGGQAFQVPDLPIGFDGIPLDGGQYLAIVRQQASKHAPVYRVTHNPYALPSKSSNKRPPPTNSNTNMKTQTTLPSTPSQAWRTAFHRKFSDARSALRNPCRTAEALELVRRVLAEDGERPPGYAALAGSSTEGREGGGDGANEGVWFKWMFGYGMRARRNLMRQQQQAQQEQASKDATNPNQVGHAEKAGQQAFGGASVEQTEYREPRTALLKTLEHEDVLQLLEYIPDWIVHPAAQPQPPSSTSKTDSSSPREKQPHLPDAIPPLLSRWAFALLLFLSEQLDADQMSVLRTLARSCGAAIVRSRLRFRVKARGLGLASAGGGGGGGKGEAKEEEEEEEMEMELSSGESADEEEEGEEVALVGPSLASAGGGGKGAREALEQLRKHVKKKRERPSPSEQEEEETEGEEEAKEQLTQATMRAERGAWLVVAAVCCGWGQSDLWEEIAGSLERSGGASSTSGV